MLDTFAFPNHSGSLHPEVGTAPAMLGMADCSPLVLLPAARAAELAPLARRAGLGTAVLGSA